ncbi:hypothetical protein PAHAL_4G266800 [Panicum hallii]|uniref:F-box/LRR-repeat protein 15/At3g58940/PEG3-like LRR domain-containing protein n=1 Tax=Panicum hallii TaxID=206008 RepID=A0A2S3HKE6_9POAL|nr:hypothetical protein PAHAL_4G266800 [Panicum hallii]
MSSSCSTMPLDVVYPTPGGSLAAAIHTCRFSSTLCNLCICSSYRVLRLPTENACALSASLASSNSLSSASESPRAPSMECYQDASVLESLLLCCNVGYRRLRIRSPTLRSLGVSNGDCRQPGELEELIVEDVPLLERLIPRNVRYFMVIRVLQAPKLKILGYLEDHCISTFQFGTLVFEKMMPVTLSTSVRTVKTLALIIASNLDLVIGLLKCFPCVEKLYIEFSYQLYSQRNCKNEQRYDQLECLDLHLKRLV